MRSLWAEERGGKGILGGGGGPGVRSVEDSGEERNSEMFGRTSDSSLGWARSMVGGIIISCRMMLGEGVASPHANFLISQWFLIIVPRPVQSTQIYYLPPEIIAYT